MARHKDVMREMLIDCEKASNIIVEFIRKKVAEQQRDGVLLGLSGGIDSTVLATLAARAVGSCRVYALHLFDRDSRKKFLEYAQKIADKLDINLEVRDISQLVRNQAVYKSLVMKITYFSPALNRLLVRLSRLAYHRQSPFTLTLQHGPSTTRAIARVLYRASAGKVEEGFNVRHRLRRRILEDYARERNLLLVGAANRTEALVGWFVKDGVDDLPIEPLMTLYKNQIRQLGRFLDIPMEIVREPPSPDMFKGVTDELAIGFSYDKMDKVLYILENGLGKETAYDEGISPTEFEGIKTLNQLSVWKRESRHEYPRLE